MAARTTVIAAADVTVEAALNFGGPSGKKRKMMTVVIKGATSTSTVDTPWTLGSTDGDFLASVLGFAKIESCSNLALFTTSTGAVVDILLAAPSLNGLGFLLSDASTGGTPPADFSLAYTQSARITLIGY